MHNWILYFRVGALLTLGIIATMCGLSHAFGATNYFLVVELPGRTGRNDSYVVPLTNSQHIAHAHDLIARGPNAAGSALVVARIAQGADGINRDLRSPDARTWSWHVTNFEGFADFTAEIMDGWPGDVENHPENWFRSGEGTIGFWNYTIVSELPLVPTITSVAQAETGLRLFLTNLTPPFELVIEAATSLPATNWMIQTNFTPVTRTTNIFLPFAGDKAFYRATYGR